MPKSSDKRLSLIYGEDDGDVGKNIGQLQQDF
jgi:hypothetical protein